MLTTKEVSQFTKNLSTFKHAEAVSGVPWEAIAAIWYRESFSVSPPKRIGGQYQFDPPLKQNMMEYLLDNFTTCTKQEKLDLIEKGINDFESATVFAACWLRWKCRPKLTPDSSDDVIKDAMYGYNGRRYGSANTSPYVMNNFDEAHKDMRIRGTVPDSKNPSKRVWIDTIDKRPGAFTVYKQLKGLNL